MIISLERTDRIGQQLKTFFDCDTINEKRYDYMETITLHCKEVDLGSIDFLYYVSGFVEIIEFKVKMQELGHGRLLMDTLFKVLTVINEKLIGIGLKGIKYITGKIEPDPNKITYPNLVKVYEKLGFEIRNGHCYMSFEDFIKR